jgi:hypothetical protein
VHYDVGAFLDSVTGVVVFVFWDGGGGAVIVWCGTLLEVGFCCCYF